MPCSCRGGYRFLIFVLMIFFIAILPRVIIGTCFILMFRKVLKSGQKFSNNGVGSLKLDLKPQPSSTQLNCHDQDLTMGKQRIKERRSCTALFRKLLSALVSKMKANSDKWAKKKKRKVFHSRAAMFRALQRIHYLFLEIQLLFNECHNCEHCQKRVSDCTRIFASCYLSIQGCQS